MRYANLILAPDVNMVNIGDYMQILAVDNLYCHMGIDIKDVAQIKVSELSSYSGEKVVLPLNYPMFGYYDLSEDIIPVYLGISVMTAACAEGLRCAEYQPVGCRDAHTYQEMRRAGLEAYCSGCLTLTFPKAGRADGLKKVFLVDVPQELLSYLPAERKKFAEFHTQIYYNENCPDKEGVRAQYEMYIREAGLIVTSKIHCVMPCLAAGIPVVFACEKASFRYNVLDGITTVYTPDRFHEIDWSPEPVDLEQRKQLMLQYAALRVRGAFEGRQIDAPTRARYQNRLNGYYRRDAEPFQNLTVCAFEQYLGARYTPEDPFEYVLWGVTQIAELTYAMVSEKYPNARLAGVIDMYRRVSFHGKDAVEISALQGLKHATVLVTAGAANPVAERYFAEYNVNRYCICYNGFHVEDGKRFSTHGALPAVGREQ